MPFHSLAYPCVAILAVFASFLGLRSRVDHPSERKKKRRFGFYPSAAGNALQQLQMIVQPAVKHVMIEMLDEETEDDASGDPDGRVDARTHLHRQAARIRRGEQVDRMTAMIDRKRMLDGPGERVTIFSREG